MKASILISSYNRRQLFRRTLHGIARNPPPVPFEVVVVDDGSTEDVLGLLRDFSHSFRWKFVEFNREEFEYKTGLKKFFNNSAVTNNIAFKHSDGDLIFQQGNEVIPVGDVYARMIADSREGGFSANWMVMSTTYDLPPHVLGRLDDTGGNLTDDDVRACARWPLQSEDYRSDVTNYISLAPRALWDALRGYDERYYAGISAEDSDFVRRARRLPGFKMAISRGVSLHQYHGGRTRYYWPPSSVITRQRWDEGVAINHRVYNSWDGTHNNRQPWPWGEFGAGRVVESCPT